MATADTRSYIEQIKEMRALRMQQLKQVNADLKYQSAMINYQRNILRTNEKMISSITSLGRTITGIVSTIGKTGGAAVGAAASGVSSVSTSIVSGLGKVLPLAIAGLLAKVMLWDNMSGDTKDRLSGGFGKLFSKLFSFVENTFDNITAGILRTVKQIQDAYKSLDIKFPIVNTVMKKFSAFVDMIAAGFEIVRPFFEGIIELVKADPAKVMKDTLKIMAGGVLLRYMIPVAASIVTTLLANRLLVNTMMKSMGVAAGGSLLGSALTGAGTAAATAYGMDKYRNGRPGRITPEVKASARMTARTAAVEAAAARGAGGRALALVPYVGWMLATGFTMYQVYETFKEFGVDKKDIDEAAARVEKETRMDKGLTTYGVRAPQPTEENIKRAAQYETESRQVDLSGGGGLVGGELAQMERIRDLQGNAEVVKAYKNRMEQKKREEQGKDLQLIEQFNEIWADMSISERRWAIETHYVIVESADFYYYPDEKGKMVRISPSDYKKAFEEVLDENISEVDKEGFKTGLAKLISKHEAGGSFDIPYGGSIKDGKVIPKYVPFPEGITGVSQMTGRQLLDYQNKQIQATMGKVGAGPNKGTGAVGGFQFNRENAAEFYSRHPELLDKPFSPEVQQMMFDEFSNGRIKELINKGDMKGLQDFVRKHWQIYSKSDTASKELAEYFMNPSRVSDSESKLSEEKRRKIAIDQYKEAYKRLMEPVSSEELQFMTMQGQNVVDTLKEKATDYYEERKKSIRDLMEKQRKANDPQELMSELLNTLNILGEVNQATNWDIPGGGLAAAPVNNYNIVNNNTSTSMAGGSGGVSPFRYWDRYDHNSMAGITRLS